MNPDSTRIHTTAICDFCGLPHSTHDKRCRATVYENGEAQRCLLEEDHESVRHQFRNAKARPVKR